MPNNKRAWPIQIDPMNCACTECIIGEYVPLSQATEDQLDLMIAGRINDATYLSELEFDEYVAKKFDW